MYKLFLCIRYLLKRRIAFFAVGAVCLCVAMVLIVVSVMGGFLQMVKDRSRGMLGDLVMESGALQGFPYYQEFIDQIKRDMPDKIVEATPVIITYGVCRFPLDDVTKAAQMVGLRLEETYRVNDFKKGLFYEKYYPGTTSFALQQQPHYGYDHKGKPVLPPPLEAAWQEWLKQADPKERDKAPIEKDLVYKRPGFYWPIPLDRAASGSAEPAYLGEERPGVILGTDLCARRLPSGEYERYYPRGTEIHLTFVPFTPKGKFFGDATGMPSRLLRYSDDCRTGVYDIDAQSVYLDFDMLQKVLEMHAKPLDPEAPELGTLPARTTQIQIKLSPSVPLNEVTQIRDQLKEAWAKLSNARLAELRDQPEMLRTMQNLVSRVQIQTWEEKQAKFIAAVEKEKYLVTILFGVISVVAVFLVGCIFYMIVQQKTRDIGIIKSVGATSLGVASIFLSYGAAVGVVGGAMGTAIGTVFVWYINEIQDLLGKISPQAVVWSPEVYTFDRIPNQVEVQDAVVIYGIAILASMAGALMAAVRAARVWPVEAIRYE